MSIDKEVPVYTFTIENRLLPNTVSFELEKKWSGDEGHEDERPESVTVSILRDGTEVNTAVLNRNNDWKAEVKNDSQNRTLLKIDPQTGKDYAYTVKEVEVSDYSCSIAEKVEIKEKILGTSDLGPKIQDYHHVVTLTNKWTGGEDLVTVRGTKTWEDDDNAAETRPESIRINILNKSQGLVRSLDVSASDNWSWSVDKLPRYDSEGEELQYYVTEGSVNLQTETDPETVTPGVDGYEGVYADPVFDEGSLTWTCDITNSNKTTSVYVRKQWEDDDDAMGLRPDSVTVHLYSQAGDEKEELAAADLSEDSGWSHVFENLPARTEDGTGITYSVEEVAVDSYTSEISGSPEEGFTITNTVDPSRGNIPVTKVWAGDEETRDKRPSSVTVRLMKGGENGEEAASIELTSREGWKGSFRGVPMKDEEGQPVSYTVKEDPVAGYEADVTGSSEEGFTVTNTFNNKITVTVEKVWEDNGQKGDRPARVTFVLYRRLPGQDGQPVREGELLFLLESEGWTRNFPDLEMYSGGTQYQYYVVETVPGGYSASYSELQESGGITLTIANSMTYRDITVRKVWDDDNSASRPSATIHLLADGQRMEGQDYNRSISGNSTTRTDPASDPGQNPSAGSSTDPGADPEKTHIETDGVAEGSIINLSGARLPSTGGPGKGIYYAAGILLALGAALLLFKKPAGTA